MPTPLRIGSRGSDLALWQARWVAARLADAGHETEITIIKTHGDRVTDRPLNQLGVQGAFTRELEEALLSDQVDLAVHSFKDMALVQPDSLAVIAISSRANPADLLVVRAESADDSGRHVPLAPGAIVGTSAVRRGDQLKALRPDLVFRDLRGNVPTRLQKLRDGNYDAIFLAAAAAERLELDLSEFRLLELNPAEFVPSPAQGALAVEMKHDHPAVEAVRNAINDDPTARAITGERLLLSHFGGGCSLPLGGICTPEENGERWIMRGFWGGGTHPVWVTESGDDPARLAAKIAQRLREEAEAPAPRSSQR